MVCLSFQVCVSFYKKKGEIPISKDYIQDDVYFHLMPNFSGILCHSKHHEVIIEDKLTNK